MAPFLWAFFLATSKRIAIIIIDKVWFKRPVASQADINRN